MEKLHRQSPLCLTGGKQCASTTLSYTLMQGDWWNSRQNMPMFCSRHHKEQHRTLPGAGRRYRRDDVTLYGVKGARLGMWCCMDRVLPWGHIRKSAVRETVRWNPQWKPEIQFTSYWHSKWPSSQMKLSSHVLMFWYVVDIIQINPVYCSWGACL